MIKKKVTIDRIRTDLVSIGDHNNNNWSIEKLESMLRDLIDQIIIGLIGDIYKIKKTQEHTLTDNTKYT